MVPGIAILSVRWASVCFPSKRSFWALGGTTGWWQDWLLQKTEKPILKILGAFSDPVQAQTRTLSKVLGTSTTREQTWFQRSVLTTRALGSSCTTRTEWGRRAHGETRDSLWAHHSQQKSQCTYWLPGSSTLTIFSHNYIFVCIYFLIYYLIQSSGRNLLL